MRTLDDLTWDIGTESRGNSGRTPVMRIIGDVLRRFARVEACLPCIRG